MAIVLNGTTGITSVNGSAAAPSVTGTDTDTGIVYGTNTVSIATGGTERLQVDSAGNLGIGVTPSAWNSAIKAIEVTGGGQLMFGSAYGTFGTNAYLDSSVQYIYKTTAAAAQYSQANGQHQWHTAASGTAGNAISFTQAMTLDASGNLGVGTSSPLNTAGYIFVTTKGSSGGGYTTYNSSNARIAELYSVGDTAYVSNYSNNPLVFLTNNTERARIDSSGRLLVGYTSTVSGMPSGSVGAVGYVTKKGTGNGLNTSANSFNISWADGLTGAHLWIDTSDLGQITLSSDYRIKKNIETQSAAAIDRVMALRAVTYELADYGTLFKADGIQREGFIAHELQEVIPSAVEGEKDAENQIQSLKLDALCSVLTKAIQEQQAIIESLKARLDAANL